MTAMASGSGKPVRYWWPPAAQSISCNLAHLAAGDTQSIVVTYHVASTTDSDPSVGNSATATEDVRNDIIHQLELAEPTVVVLESADHLARWLAQRDVEPEEERDSKGSAS